MGAATSKTISIADVTIDDPIGASNTDCPLPTSIDVCMLSCFLKRQHDIPSLKFYLSMLRTTGTTFVLPLFMFVGSNLLVESPFQAFGFSLGAHLLGCLHLWLINRTASQFYVHHHNFVHRPMFHSSLMNDMWLWFFGSLFGLYALKEHHIVMHHHEDNCEPDISSTERYNRSSWLDFRRYQFRFIMLVDVELFCYIYRVHPRWLARLSAKAFAWYSVLFVIMSKVSPLAGFYALLAPRVIMLSKLSFYNWADHLFVDSTSSGPGRSAMNCVNSRVNWECHNIGYHLCHHMNPSLHWCELPTYLQTRMDDLREMRSLMFVGLSQQEVATAVMNNNIGLVCRHYVHMGPDATKPTLLEVELELGRRLLPIQSAPHNLESPMLEGDQLRYAVGMRRR
eukprot:TRINITY_DN34309_c0_g1_i1.p1 TRINITY_DN34309_c0_g1~~TRINITY_DN34309_c0_g1_i1.p1  ORF type:complete len:414 (-),score=38.68 TRINITY_DN34309_c0_g1_i1:277-1461(-)